MSQWIALAALRDRLEVAPSGTTAVRTSSPCDIDMCTGMPADVWMDQRSDMCTGMCIEMYMETCTGM